jgi:hypothetical protein
MLYKVAGGERVGVPPTGAHQHQGWHRRVKQEAHLRGDLNLYLLIKLLHDEAQHARLQVRLLSEGRLRRHVRRNVMSVNGRLQALWDSYDAGDVSTSTFLRRAARLQLPNWLQ